MFNSRSGDLRLPSFLRRNASLPKKRKAPKITQYNRDVMCLPSSYGDGGQKCISIPRGQQRAYLAKLGLQGKVTLSSVMCKDSIRDEIRSAFKEAMGQDSSFPFTFLQTSGYGAKTLAVPSLSSSFQWTAQEVCKLSKSSCIYILAEKRLAVEDVKVKTHYYCKKFNLPLFSLPLIVGN